MASPDAHEPEEPEPIPQPVAGMVEEDEGALAPGQKPEPPAVSRNAQPTRFEAVRDRPPLTAGLGYMFAGISLGMLLIAGILFGLSGCKSGGQPQVGLTPATAVAQASPMIAVATSTPSPDLPMATPVVPGVIATPQPAPSQPETGPTPAEGSDTPDNATLGMNEWWKKSGVWLRVLEVQFATGGDVMITLELWNRTGSRLSFTWALTRNLSLEGNTGRVYPLGGPFPAGIDSVDAIYEAGAARPLYWGGYSMSVQYYDSNEFWGVRDVYLTATDLSRISHARFRIPVRSPE